MTVTPPDPLVTGGASIPDENPHVAYGGWGYLGAEHVYFMCPERNVSMRCLLGPDGAKLSEGVGGLSTVDIPRHVQAVTFTSQPPWKLSVNLMFDGLATNTSIEQPLRALIRSARIAPGEGRPPTVKWRGPVPRWTLDWLIEDFDWGTEVIRREGDAERIRQDVTVHCIEDRHPEFVARRPKPRYRTYVVHKGDTLKKIARKFGVSVPAIMKLNKIRDRRKIRRGQRLRIPPKPKKKGGK